MGEPGAHEGEEGAEEETTGFVNDDCVEPVVGHDEQGNESQFMEFEETQHPTEVVPPQDVQPPTEKEQAQPSSQKQEKVLPEEPKKDEATEEKKDKEEIPREPVSPNPFPEEKDSDDEKTNPKKKKSIKGTHQDW